MKKRVWVVVKNLKMEGVSSRKGKDKRACSRGLDAGVEGVYYMHEDAGGGSCCC